MIIKTKGLIVGEQNEIKESNGNNKSKKKIKSTNGTFIAVIALVVLFGLLYAWFNSGGGASNTVKESTSEKEGHSEVEAWVAVKIEVENNLKSPKTASFPLGTKGHVTKINNNVFKVKAYVDSENSFGANIRTNFSCTVEFTGEYTYRIKDLEFWE